MKKTLCFFLLLFLFFSPNLWAAEKVTIIYQNDLHGWLFPASNRAGIRDTADMLSDLFRDEPNSFYAVSGDLFKGPNLPKHMKGSAELGMWNRFRDQLEIQGYGDRILISAGNHEFDYGVPGANAFHSGLLCANLMTESNKPYYVPYKVIKTSAGLRIGFLGLLLTENRYVLHVVEKNHLKVIPMLDAIKKYIPEMGPLDLTVLMIHDHLRNIVKLTEQIPPDLGIDIILSGHDHALLEKPLQENGFPVFQAGAMNEYYGKVDLLIEKGKVLSIRNRIGQINPSPLTHETMKIKEASDALKKKKVAVLKSSLTGVCLRNQESNLGDFSSDAFRWAAGTDVAMTNSSSMRTDFRLYNDEPMELREGDFTNLMPFGDHLVIGRVTGTQLLRILEYNAVMFVNQISGITCKVDPNRPEGSRIVAAEVGGETLFPDKIYTLAHNSYCARPENMKKYLHLDPGSVTWEDTDHIAHEALADYARHLKVIDYPEESAGRMQWIQ